MKRLVNKEGQLDVDSLPDRKPVELPQDWSNMTRLEVEDLKKVKPLTVLQFARTSKSYCTYGYTRAAHWTKHLVSASVTTVHPERKLR